MNKELPLITVITITKNSCKCKNETVGTNSQLSHLFRLIKNQTLSIGNAPDSALNQ